MLAGNKKTLAFLIGSEQKGLLEVRTFLGGLEISSDDINAYTPQFAYSLDCDVASLKKAFSNDRTELFQSIPERELITLFRNKVPESKNAEQIEAVMHEHQILDFGPTHDHLSCYLIPTTKKEKLYCHYYQWDGANNEPLSLITLNIALEEVRQTLSRTSKIINAISLKNTSLN